MEHVNIIERKILRIFATTGFLEEVSGTVMDVIEPSRILATQQMPLSAEEFNCDELVVLVQDPVRIWGAEGTKLCIEAPRAEGYAVAKSASAYAYAKHAKVYAQALGSAAYASYWDSTAYATVKGASAYATIRFAEACALADGARSYATAEGAKAYADAKGSKAYAEVPGSEAEAEVGAKAYRFNASWLGRLIRWLRS